MNRLIFALFALSAIDGKAASAGDLTSDLSSGQTTLAVWVDANGRANRVEIRKSCGRRDCDTAAMSLAQNMPFAPAKDAAERKEPRILIVGSDGKPHFAPYIR